MLIELSKLFKYDLIVEVPTTAPAQIIESIETPHVEPSPTDSEAPSSENYLKLEDRLESTPKEKDVELATIAILGKKGNSLLKGQEQDPKLLKELVGKTGAPVLLFSYLLRPDFRGVKLSEGLKVVLAEDGSFKVPQTGSTEGQSIKQIFRREGKDFSCDLGDGKETLVPIETVLSADVVSIFSDGETVQQLVKDGLFTPQEVQIIQAYVDSVTGKGQESTEKIDESVLREVALSSGLISSESLRLFAEKNGLVLRETDNLKIEADSDEEKTKISTENIEHNKKVQEILELFEGRIVASPEIVATVIQTILPEQIEPLKSFLGEEMVKIKLEIENLRTSGSNDPQKIKELRSQEEQINQQRLFIQQAELMMEYVQTTVINLFSSVQRGEEEVEIIRSLDDGLHENNPEKIITSLLPSKNVEEAEKVRGFFAKHGKTIGKFSLLAALGLMYALMKSGKEQPQGAYH